ncbi:MAG: hypothetical protein H7287_12535 [Thermoleophilia bacterium]|nr:hypothetical protein [Thermoleophilia bacterium]
MNASLRTLPVIALAVAAGLAVVIAGSGDDLGPAPKPLSRAAFAGSVALERCLDQSLPARDIVQRQKIAATHDDLQVLHPSKRSEVGGEVVKITVYDSPARAAAAAAADQSFYANRSEGDGKVHSTRFQRDEYAKYDAPVVHGQLWVAFAHEVTTSTRAQTNDCALEFIADNVS